MCSVFAAQRKITYVSCDQNKRLLPVPKNNGLRKEIQLNEVVLALILVSLLPVTMNVAFYSFMRLNFTSTLLFFCLSVSVISGKAKGSVLDLPI